MPAFVRYVLWLCLCLIACMLVAIFTGSVVAFACAGMLAIIMGVWAVLTPSPPDPGRAAYDRAYEVGYANGIRDYKALVATADPEAHQAQQGRAL